MRRSLWPLLVVVLVVVGAVLIALALRPAQQLADAPLPTQTTTSRPTASVAGTPKAAVGSTRVIVVPVDGTHAWRITTGASCPGSVRLTRTSDSGKTWQPGPKSSLAMVSSATANDAGEPLLKGLNAQCAAISARVTQSRVETVDTSPAWAINPLNPSTLLHVGQAPAPACGGKPVRDLAADSAQRATVLCTGGVIRRTTDGGGLWTTVATVKTATGIASASAAQGHRLFVASARDCGIRVAAVQDELAGTVGRCVDGTASVKTADIALWGRTIWVVGADGGWTTQVPAESGGAAPTASGSG